MRFLLAFVFALPCQAQYLDFQIKQSTTGGYSYVIEHQLYKSEGHLITIVLSSISGQNRCQPDPEVTLVLANYTTDQTLEAGARLVVNDSKVIHLHKTIADISENGIVVFAYKVSLIFDDLMEMNDYGNTYNLGGYNLPGIRDAIDEYLKQILALPECSD